MCVKGLLALCQVSLRDFVFFSWLVNIALLTKLMVWNVAEEGVTNKSYNNKTFGLWSKRIKSSLRPGCIINPKSFCTIEVDFWIMTDSAIILVHYYGCNATCGWAASVRNSHPQRNEHNGMQRMDSTLRELRNVATCVSFLKFQTLS